MTAQRRSKAAKPKADKPAKPPPELDPQTKRFVPGNNGGPGRPKGSRNKLGEAFITALQADFEQHGEKVISQVREEKPDAYLKVIASILPQHMTVTHQFDEMTDDQLRRQAEQLLGDLGPLIAFASGGNAVRAEAPEQRKPPGGVPPVH